MLTVLHASSLVRLLAAQLVKEQVLVVALT
jgi:hypothetical protein